ncbi:DUF3617 domain-containing protein [Sphingomonas flavalba]|uniref:DUF3617 domain-containing protein n=1 Tax=Sphingomonas flavalba TaxID=2559804 RepID=UPI0039E17203
MFRFSPAASLPFAPLLLLAACNSGPTVSAENASASEVAQKIAESRVSEGSFISPGQWRTTFNISEMNMPGLPPQALEAMRAHAAKASSHESCVTEEQAKKPDPDMFAGKGNENCRYDNFSMGNGKIAGVLRCQGSPGEMKMTMNGTYGPNAYQMSATVEQTGPQGKMTMKMDSKAERIGPCKA